MTRTPQQIEADLDNEIRDTVRRIYSPLQRQARDSIAFVVLALFLSTSWLLVHIVVN